MCEFRCLSDRVGDTTARSVGACHSDHIRHLDSGGDSQLRQNLCSVLRSCFVRWSKLHLRCAWAAAGKLVAPGLITLEARRSSRTASRLAWLRARQAWISGQLTPAQMLVSRTPLVTRARKRGQTRTWRVRAHTPPHLWTRAGVWCTYTAKTLTWRRGSGWAGRLQCSGKILPVRAVPHGCAAFTLYPRHARAGWACGSQLGCLLQSVCSGGVVWRCTGCLC